jgi:hypothetical protein
MKSAKKLFLKEEMKKALNKPKLYLKLLKFKTQVNQKPIIRKMPNHTQLILVRN